MQTTARGSESTADVFALHGVRDQLAHASRKAFAEHHCTVREVVIQCALGLVVALAQ